MAQLLRASLLPLAAVVLAAAAFAAPGASTTETAEEPAAAKQADAPKVEVPFHGNALCPLMGKPAKANKFVEKDGERVYLCCSKCRTKAKADFAAQREKAYPQDQVVDVKNERCPIGGEEVDGETSLVFQGYRVQLCCAGCEEKFRADPRKHLALLLDPELVALGNTTCPVMAEEKAEPDHFVVVDGVLIDTCCGDCPDMIQEDPVGTLAKAGIDLEKVKADAKAKRAAKKAEGDSKDD